MREKLRRFMDGRYGADDLSRMHGVVVMILLVLSLFGGLGILYWIALALMIYSIWRMMSRNVSKRYEENRKYLDWRYQTTVKREKWKKRWQQRAVYRFYKCPCCKQTVRVPRGRGKICITCPKCRTEFVRRS